MGDFVAAAKWLSLAATFGHEGAASLYASNALDLDPESLASAQKQAAEWLNEQAANDDRLALHIAEIRAGGKATAEHEGEKFDAVLLH